MINTKEFYDFLVKEGVDYFVGVPDSQLKEFCDTITDLLGIGDKHIIAANEGNAVGLAAGYHLATGKTGLVYLQNSGLGNAVNPITSLTDQKVYGIPMVYLIGWRGEPGVHDEPQHIKQGAITLDLLKNLDVEYHIISKESNLEELLKVFSDRFKTDLESGKSVAFVVKKGSFEAYKGPKPVNDNEMSREDIIKTLIDNIAQDACIVSTTGKTSRELFEYRESKGQGHEKDFLTVGSMGHASMIALAIAENKESKEVWCVDGDGAALMHMGSLALIGARSPKNYFHLIINNGAHESVGGMPTIAYSLNFEKIAVGCGYKAVYRANNKQELITLMRTVKNQQGPILIEALANIDSRADLGRPTTTPAENKKAFMNFLDE